MILLTYVAIVALILVLIILAKAVRPWFRASLLALSMPGPPALPIVGNALSTTDPNVAYTLGRTVCQTCGTIFRIWITIIPAVMVVEPKYVQQILASPKHVEKIFFYRFLHNFLGEGLITSTESKWKMHRKLIQPLFNLSILEQYIEIFSYHSQQLVKDLKVKCKTENELNIVSPINQTVLNILNEGVLGVSHRSGENLSDESPFRKGKVTAPYRITHPWLMFNSIYKLTNLAKSDIQQKLSLDNFTRKMIQKYKENKDVTSEKNNDFKNNNKKSLLQLFMEVNENNPQFSEDHVVQELGTFMLAGQESVASAVAFCLHYLATNKSDQDIVVNELDKIFDGSTRIPTMQDLSEMRYLDQCIKETLRLIPSVPIIARTVGHDVQLGKYLVPSGCSVVMAPYLIHRLPEIYPDPEKFDPRRFSAENVKNRHPFAYIPFSAGPRNCIGNKFALLEMKTIISTLLREYEIGITKNHSELKIYWRITVRARGGVWISLVPRNVNTE